MPITPVKLFAPLQLPASVAIQYTVPVNTRVIIKKLTLTNPTGTARIVTIHLVPSGGSVLDANKITHQKTVAPGQSVDVFEAENHILQSEDTIRAFADAATAVTFMGSGLEVT